MFSNHMVRTAFKLKREKGILSEQKPKKGKIIPDSVVQLVKAFYCDDEFSRLLPGKKDCVSISKGVHQQKRLLLLNLNELYAAFKNKFPNEKIGYSKFCMLRPKWCVTVGSMGTHSVCVCSIHQNVKLLLKAVNLDKSYHDLIEMFVCDRSSRDSGEESVLRRILQDNCCPCLLCCISDRIHH